jgi:hypothetical protein
MARQGKPFSDDSTKKAAKLARCPFASYNFGLEVLDAAGVEPGIEDFVEGLAAVAVFEGARAGAVTDYDLLLRRREVSASNYP